MTLVFEVHEHAHKAMESTYDAASEMLRCYGEAVTIGRSTRRVHLLALQAMGIIFGEPPFGGVSIPVPRWVVGGFTSTRLYIQVP